MTEPSVPNGGTSNDPAPACAAAQAARSEGPIRRKRLYLSVTTKYVIAVTFAVLWTSVAVWLSLPWIDDLSRSYGPPAAWIVVSLVAYLPGYIVALMAMSLILDRQPSLRVLNPTTPLTIIVAARNEQAGKAETIRCLGRADYARPVRVILADNG